MCLGSCGNTDRTPCCGAEESFLEEVIPPCGLEHARELAQTVEEKKSQELGLAENVCL